MQVAMTVLRDGYWEGRYPRRGDTITVEASLVASLELAGFATREAAGEGPPRVAPTGRKAHGR